MGLGLKLKLLWSPLWQLGWRHVLPMTITYGTASCSGGSVKAGGDLFLEGFEFPHGRCPDVVFQAGHFRYDVGFLAAVRDHTWRPEVVGRIDNHSEIHTGAISRKALYRTVHNPAAHHRVAGLCAARWCAAGLCAGRLGCVEGHSWIWPSNHSMMSHDCVGTVPMFATSDKSLDSYREYYNDVIISAMASRITSLTIVYWSVCSGADQRKHQSSASLAFVRGIHRWPANSLHKGPVTRKMFPFDDVIARVVNLVNEISLDYRQYQSKKHFLWRHHNLLYPKYRPVFAHRSKLPNHTHKQKCTCAKVSCVLIPEILDIDFCVTLLHM